MTYQIVVKPTYNIVFLDQYLNMCKIELQWVFKSHGIEVENLALALLNKGYILSFHVTKELDTIVLKAIYHLSFFFMIFHEAEGGSLKPVAIDYQPDFGDDLSIRMKYNGKTNETITRMMISLALAASDFSTAPYLKLLDPLCGRGTTLFEGMISGFDVYGVDCDQKSIDEMETYIVRYLKDAKLKHLSKRGKIAHKGQLAGEVFELQYAKEKADFKAGHTRELRVVKGDTTNFYGAFKQNDMHVLVTDFPYNVQHSGKGPQDQKGLRWLLEAGLDSWTPFLKKGAGVAISWNIYTDKRQTFVDVFEKMGYEVLNEGGLDQLEHRVAQAITRDIIVAKKV